MPNSIMELDNRGHNTNKYPLRRTQCGPQVIKLPRIYLIIFRAQLSRFLGEKILVDYIGGCILCICKVNELNPLVLTEVDTYAPQRECQNRKTAWHFTVDMVTEQSTCNVALSTRCMVN